MQGWVGHIECGRWHFEGTVCLAGNQKAESVSFPCYWKSYIYPYLVLEVPEEALIEARIESIKRTFYTG